MFLIKCSTYEIIDNIFCNELDYMFCTGMKILNDKTILCGFHMYDSYSNYVHIKINNKKLKIIGIKNLRQMNMMEKYVELNNIMI